MPELVTIKTSHFECVIWAKDISASQQRLQQTMSDRNKSVTPSIIHFNPPLMFSDSKNTVDTYHCNQALFFENKLYDIEFVFSDDFKKSFINKPPHIFHRLKSVEDAFHYNARSHSLRATINTANDIGWFSIELEYEHNNKSYVQTVAFEILPTKIDMSADINQMNALIDAQYPLWRFTLAEKTQQKLSAIKRPHPQFLLLWLAQFESLRGEFEKGLKHIVHAPHSRLISIEVSLKPERLKGKLNPKIEMAIRQAQCNGITNKRFLVQKKQLSVDTPENRFIKAIIKMSIDKLATIARIVGENQKTQNKQRLSDSFFNKLAGWQGSLKCFQRHALFQEVGDFSGLSKESLVLQQKSGYAKVYRVWQELKLYLDLMGNDSSLSLRNVAELYEVWCFLEFKHILLDLGFEETFNKKDLLRKDGLEFAMNDGNSGAFRFKRKDGICLKLAHERQFRKDTTPVKTWTTVQKPDILLEAAFPDGTEIIWLFDAKYRIDSDENSLDLVPDDAINQLHRYRDALIHQHLSVSNFSEKSRPIFGAYALYPGYFNQCETPNPYQQSIDEISIGAFSLLPGYGENNSYWLREFLREKLGLSSDSYAQAESDRYFVEDGVRIPSRGTSVSHYNDLTLAVSGIVPERNKHYSENLELGQLKHYHMRLLASDRQNIEQNVIHELRYLAIAVSVTDTLSAGMLQQINYLYPILQVQQTRRIELTEEQTGTSKIKDPEQIYWLFKLGKALRLNSSVVVDRDDIEHFEVKLTSAPALFKGCDWSALPQRYKLLVSACRL